jgi:hypothetical protein
MPCARKGQIADQGICQGLSEAWIAALGENGSDHSRDGAPRQASPLSVPNLSLDRAFSARKARMDKRIQYG